MCRTDQAIVIQYDLKVDTNRFFGRSAVVVYDKAAFLTRLKKVIFPNKRMRPDMIGVFSVSYMLCLIQIAQSVFIV